MLKGFVRLSAGNAVRQIFRISDVNHMSSCFLFSQGLISNNDEGCQEK